MKYLNLKLAIILIAFAFTGCNTAPNFAPEATKTEGYSVVRFGACQYIEVKGGLGDSSVYSLTHKGDCDNPNHCENRKTTINSK